MTDNSTPNSASVAADPGPPRGTARAVNVRTASSDNRRRWSSRRILVIVTATAFVAVLAWLFRPAAVFGFVAVGPGLVLLPALRGLDWATRAMLAVAVSVAVTAVVSEVLAIAHWWSATGLLLTLAVGCLIAGTRRGGAR